MYTLKILLAGLIALVPVEENGSVTKVWGLFPASYDVEDVECKQKGKKYNLHYASVVIPTKHVVGGPIPALPGIGGSGEIGSNYLLQLDGETLSIETSQRDQRSLEVADPPASNIKVPKTTEEEQEHLWIIDMRRADPKHSRVQPALLGDTVPPLPARSLAARLLIDSGRLHTEKMAESMDGTVLLFDMKGGPRDSEQCKGEDAYCQALDQVTALELDDLRDPVALVFRSIRSGRETRRITLQPESKGAIVEVRVAHQTARALIDRSPSLTESLELEDYRWFLTISTNQDCDFIVPSLATGPLGDPFCPRPWMAP